jgi:hypothetical protein
VAGRGGGGLQGLRVDLHCGSKEDPSLGEIGGGTVALDYGMPLRLAMQHMGCGSSVEKGRRRQERKRGEMRGDW